MGERDRRRRRRVDPDLDVDIDTEVDQEDYKREQSTQEADPELTDLPAGQEEELPEDIEVSLDELEVETGDADEDLAVEDQFDTQHTDGHTYNPWIAADQGLTYTPPTDPPTVASNRRNEGIEIGAGFSPSMEETNPDEEILPDGVDNQALDLEEDVLTALRYNSETGHLGDVRVYAEAGIVSLFGTVPSEDDLGRVYEIVYELEGVREVRNHLEVEE